MSASPSLPVLRKESGFRSTLLTAALAHLWMLRSTTEMWDSTIMALARSRGGYEDMTQCWEGMGAFPTVPVLHFVMSRLPFTLFLYKALTFVSVLVIAGSLYVLLRRAARASATASYAGALITLLYPFYDVWAEPIMVPYALCYAAFTLALVGLDRALDAPLSVPAYGVVLVLLAFAFTTPSMLVMHYAALAALVVGRGRAALQAHATTWALRLVPALAAPLLHFFLQKAFFPPSAKFAGYNAIALSPFHVFKGFISLKRITLDTLVFTVRELAAAPTLIVIVLLGTLAGAFTVGRLIPRQHLCAHPTSPDAPPQQPLIGILIVAGVLFVAAFFPYAMVKKYPLIGGYVVRHGLLLSAPIGVAAAALIGAAQARAPRATLLVVTLTLGLFIGLGYKNAAAWELRQAEATAAIEHVAQRAEPGGLLVMHRPNPLGRVAPLRDYALTGGVHLRTGRGDTLILTARDDLTEPLAEALHQWNATTYGFETYRYDAQGERWTLRPKAETSRLRVLWRCAVLHCTASEAAAFFDVEKVELKGLPAEIAPPEEWLGPR